MANSVGTRPLAGIRLMEVDNAVNLALPRGEPTGASACAAACVSTRHFAEPLQLGASAPSGRFLRLRRLAAAGIGGGRSAAEGALSFFAGNAPAIARSSVAGLFPPRAE